MVGLSRWLVIGRLDRGYERDIRFMFAKYNKKARLTSFSESRFLWVVMDSNHRRRKPADLQSAPFGHSGNHPIFVHTLLYIGECLSLKLIF